jgi:hypothetical protein
MKGTAEPLIHPPGRGLGRKVEAPNFFGYAGPAITPSRGPAQPTLSASVIPPLQMAPVSDVQ